jgi:hypothetical protein
MMAFMAAAAIEWVVLAYKLPLQPTRLRNHVWRKLQGLGAVYVQDGVVALPNRPDLNENLSYVAATIEEMEGSAILFKAEALSPKDQQKVVERFRIAGDGWMSEILGRLEELEIKLPDDCSMGHLMKAEESLKRERVAYLKARRMNYFGADQEDVVESKIASLGRQLAEYARGVK